MTDAEFGYMFTMRAKPGQGEKLREALSTANAQSTDVASWLICAVDDDADALVGFEFYVDESVAERHQQDPAVQQIQAEVGALLAEPPHRTTVRPTATSLPLSR